LQVAAKSGAHLAGIQSEVLQARDMLAVLPGWVASGPRPDGGAAALVKAQAELPVGAFYRRHGVGLNFGDGQVGETGVARALAVDPPVMLMDEPFAAVDPIVRGRLQDQFLEIQERLRKTIVFVTHDVDEAIKLSDRMAILNIGGVLEQFDPPETVLREPVNDFVREFVGAERGLKRLALIKVDDIEVEPGPVVAPGAGADEARRAIDAAGFGWVSVVDEGELLGWVDHQALQGCATAGEATPRRFSAYVTGRDSLRQALDSIVTSRTAVAVVVTEGQHYRGVLTLERVSQEILA